MPHGTPDYGVTAGSLTTYQLNDMAELAARLWSIDYFDRRGELIFQEDFECGAARFQTNQVGVGAGSAVSTAEARSGQNSWKLTSGNAGGDFARLIKYLPVPHPSGLGLECSVRIQSGLPRVQLRMTYYDGVNATQFDVRYDANTQVLDYTDGSGGHTTLASGLVLTNTVSIFHTLKVVADPTTGKYLRIIVNGTTYALAAVPVYVSPSANGPYLYVELICSGRGGFNDAIYVDDWIVTQNEPP